MGDGASATGGGDGLEEIEIVAVAIKKMANDVVARFMGFCCSIQGVFDA